MHFLGTAKDVNPLTAVCGLNGIGFSVFVSLHLRLQTVSRFHSQDLGSGRFLFPIKQKRETLLDRAQTLIQLVDFRNGGVN
jgi:hypothetical protein